MVSGFPPTESSNYEDLLVEYLEVYVPKEQEQLESKHLIDGCLKSESSASDSDSGRGSCDSHTLLMDKCGELKSDKWQTGRERTGTEAQNGWEEGALAYADVNMVSPDVSSGRVKTWPSVFSPVPQYSSNLLEQQSSLEMAKQHYLSDSLFPPGSTPSYPTQPGNGTKEAHGPSYWEFSSSNRQPHLLHPQMQTCRQLQAHSDVNISSIGRYEAPATPPPAVEEYMVALGPVKTGSGLTEGCPKMLQGEDYSKVKGVEKDNTLLLQREEAEEVSYTLQQETNGVKDTSTTKKPAAHIHSDMPTQEEAFAAASGYVDTATVCKLSSF